MCKRFKGEYIMQNRFGFLLTWREHYWWQIVVLIATTLLLLAWHNQFIQDDALITFRYSLNLANGLGPIWNEGERVEGYTNFLWMLLMTLPLLFKGDPVIFSKLLGLLCFIGSLSMTYLLAKRIFQSAVAALVAMVILGTNYTLSLIHI